MSCYFTGGVSIKSESQIVDQYYELGRVFQHVIAMPARDGDESDGLGVVSDLFDEVGSFLHDFVESILRPLDICVLKSAHCKRDLGISILW
jgi:hypothetical protein